MMRRFGAELSLAQLQQRLRYSAVVWLGWFVLLAPWLSAIHPIQAAVLAWIGALPALLLMPVLWRAKNGQMLIFAALILLIYLGHGALGFFKNELLRATINLLLLLNLLYWLGWVIARLPRLQAPAHADPQGD